LDCCCPVNCCCAAPMRPGILCFSAPHVILCGQLVWAIAAAHCAPMCPEVLGFLAPHVILCVQLLSFGINRLCRLNA
jgi:hypothetical protein